MMLNIIHLGRHGHVKMRLVFRYCEGWRHAYLNLFDMIIANGLFCEGNYFNKFLVEN